MRTPVVLLVLSAAAAVHGQPCAPSWEALGGGVQFGVSQSVPAWFMTAFDEDGDGPLPEALFVGGSFTQAGGQPISMIARWSGGSWSPLGGGLAGGFSATDAVAFDEDGAGPLPPGLVVTGDFTQAAGASVNRVARWDGQTWSGLGAGIGGAGYSLAVFDADGPGPAPEALYIGGNFATAGGVSAFTVARYQGGAWSSAAFPTPGVVRDFGFFDEDGPGPVPARLFAGGSYMGGWSHLSRYNGVGWSQVGTGVTGEVRTFVTGDPDGAGPLPTALIVGGGFGMAGGVLVSGLAAWSGTAWSSLDGGQGFNNSVRAVAIFDPAGSQAEARLYVGGLFTIAGGAASPNLVRLSGAAWEGVGGGVSGVPAGSLGPPRVNALLVFDDDGAGPRPPGLYVGGAFVDAGGLAGANSVARWACAALCYADCNADRSLTVADFGCFQAKFVAGDPYADCNGDAGLTIADFACFQSKFVAGCP